MVFKTFMLRTMNIASAAVIEEASSKTSAPEHCCGQILSGGKVGALGSG